MTDRFLGWTARDVRIRDANATWSDLALDWQPEDMRNCSFARDVRWIGVGATLAARRVLRIHEYPSMRRVRALDDAGVLQHTLASDGRTIIYTRPGEKTSADLLVDDGQTTKTVLRSAVAQRSTPSLFPDASRVALESLEGAIELVDLASGARTPIGNGMSAAVDPAGTRVAFHDHRDLYVHDLRSGETATLRRHGLFGARTLIGPLSWSPDGERIAFAHESGITGKNATFATIDVSSGKRVELDHGFLRGVLFLDEAARDVAGGPRR
jgi:hypothetical protein